MAKKCTFPAGCGALSACAVGCGGGLPGRTAWPVVASLSYFFGPSAAWGELNDEEQRFWPQMATEYLLPCHILAAGPWLGRVLLIYRAPATSGPGMQQCTR